MKRSVTDRFFAKVDCSGEGCWLWLGAPDWRGGYGHLRVGTRMVKAHRLAWTLQHGEVPPGMSVLHRCDRPLCVRVDHLFLGTQADNMHDMKVKGRSSKRPGTARVNAVLDDAKVLAIKESSEPQTVLALRYGVSTSTIFSVIHGKRWTHVKCKEQCI